MLYPSFYRNVTQSLEAEFPHARPLAADGDLERLISPHVLRLPKTLAERAEQAIAAHFALTRDPARRRLWCQEQPWLEQAPDSDSAVLMAYDFHTTPAGQPFLVEVNTNASAYLLSLVAYRGHGLTANWRGRAADDALWDSFQREAVGRTIRRLAVVDDDINAQKMRLEFFMYQDWFERRGWPAVVAEASALRRQNGRLLTAAGDPVDFVYNRLTDFYFSDPRFAALREAWTKGAAIVSPNPLAYLRFADKGRLTELSRDGGLPAPLKQVMIPSFLPKDIGSTEEIWAKRKTLFFKPRQSYGGKSVYRGETVSKKVFDRLMAEDIIIQEYVPAQAWVSETDDPTMANWKFDLRLFVYRDQVQLAIARLYRGQVTNFASRYGGLTAVEFV